MANRSRVIALSVNDLKELERLVRASSTPAGLSRRARAILLMSEGLSGVEVADKTGYTDVQVSRIRRRFAEEGMAGLHERARSGRPPFDYTTQTRSSCGQDAEKTQARYHPVLCQNSALLK